MFHKTTVSSANKAVMVTGCSSGIGRAAAVRLAKGGFTVFATVRRQSDAEALRQFNDPNLIPVCPLDLTRRDQFPAIVARVKEELAVRHIDGLYAIVNNAGGGSVAPIELMDLDKFRIELETRIIGAIALLQAFLPLIRQAHGRVIWIATPAIMPVSFVASVHACDFAVNCIARTLNIELKQWKIPNVLVRCGGIRTGSPAKTERELEEAVKQWPSERLELYRQSLQKEQAFFTDFDKKRSAPEEVAEMVLNALCAGKPKARYQVGYMARAAVLLECLPQPLADFILMNR